MIVGAHTGRFPGDEAASPSDWSIPDAARLMFLGTLLVALAAVIRKAL
jgi:hypothetical protein